MKITKLSAAFLLPLALNFTHPAQAAISPAVRNPFLPPAAANTGGSRPAAPVALVNAPAHVSTHPLSYAKAAELRDNLKEIFTGKLGVEPITNSLLFNGSLQEEQQLRQLLRQLDIPTQQITLEAKIIAVSREYSKSLGVNWGWDTIPQRDSNSSDDDATDTTDDIYGGNFKFWRGYSFRFNATLNALISNGKAKILATPRIITIPGKEASIFIGDHIPVQTEKHDSSGSYTSTEYLDAGIKLQYTPVISQDGSMVMAAVHTEVSTPTLISELKNYRITSRTADTHVRMFNGETLVIGGLINEEEQRNMQKVPLLSSIPLLGELFKSRTTRHNQVEVFMLLTPHITEAGTSPAIYSSEYLPEKLSQEAQATMH